MNTQSLTANETALLLAIPGFDFVSDYSIDDHIESEGYPCWADTFTRDASWALAIDERAVGGVISSLIKKGLLQFEDGGGAHRDDTIYITAEAFRWIKTARESASA